MVAGDDYEDSGGYVADTRCRRMTGDQSLI
jgi:hypothetical protein